MFQTVYDTPETFYIRMVTKFRHQFGGFAVNHDPRACAILGDVDCFRDGEHEVLHFAVVWVGYTTRGIHNKSDVNFTRTTQCTCKRWLEMLNVCYRFELL